MWPNSPVFSYPLHISMSWLLVYISIIAYTVLGCKLNQVKSYPIFIFMLNHDQITILYKRYRYKEPRPRALRLPYHFMISVLWCKIKLCLKIVYRHKVMNYSMCTGIVIILYLVGTNGCAWVSMGVVRSRGTNTQKKQGKKRQKWTNLVFFGPNGRGNFPARHVYID